MSRIKHVLWGNKRRKIGATLGVFGLMAGAAFAYYVLIGQGSTTAQVPVGTATTGQVNLSTTITPPTGGLVPGSSSSVQVDASNPSTTTIADISSLQAGAITVDSAHAAAGCQASWFSLGSPTGESFPVSVQANGGTAQLAVYPLTFNNLNLTDQTSCSGATLSVTFSTP